MRKKIFMLIINEANWSFSAACEDDFLYGCETFLAHPDMQAGDFVILYRSEKGLREAGDFEHLPGVYALGIVDSKEAKKQLCVSDYNYKKKVVKVRVVGYNEAGPLMGTERLKPYGKEPVQPRNRVDLDLIKERFELFEFRAPFDEIFDF